MRARNFLVDMVGIVAMALVAGCGEPPNPVDDSLVEVEGRDEEQDRSSIENAAISAVNTRNFSRLNQMMGHYRAVQARTRSGLWKSGIVHGALEWQLFRDMRYETSCNSRDAEFVRDWLAFSPDEPTALILQARMQKDRAWCLRGSRIAARTEPHRLDLFRQELEVAMEMLEDAHDKASIDPEYYAVMATIYVGLGVDQDSMVELLEVAAAREPYYLRTYFNATMRYLSKWGGNAAMMEGFALYAVEKTKVSDNTGFYYRIYWFLDQCECGAELTNWDRDRLKQAMRDVYARYPDAFNARRMMDDNCRAGDIDEAKTYMKAIAPAGSDDTALAAMIDSCKAMAANRIS